MVVALNLGEAFPQYIPLIVTMVIVAVGLTFADWALKKRSQWVGSRQNFVRLLAMLGITAVALIAIIIALPLNEGTTNQLLGLLGGRADGYYCSVFHYLCVERHGRAYASVCRIVPVGRLH